MSTKLMRRFGIASIVLAVVGALLSVFASPDSSKPQVAARSQIVPPVKKALAQRRSKRAWIVLAERVGENGDATRGAAHKAATMSQPQTVLTTPPAARVRVTAPAQVAPAAPKAFPKPVAPDRAASVDYLPPSSMQLKEKPGGTDEAAASKPKPRAKYSTRQTGTGTGVVYRTQQTSGQQRSGSRERGQRERGHGARGDSGYATWGW